MLSSSPLFAFPFLTNFGLRRDLVAAVDILRPLMLNRTLGNVPSLRMGLWDAATYHSKDHYWPENAGRPVPDDIEDAIVKGEDLGHWVFYGSVFHSLPPHFNMLNFSLGSGLFTVPIASRRRLGRS